MGTKFGASALTFNEMWVHFLRVHLFSLFFYAQRYACTVYAIVVVVVVCVCVTLRYCIKMAKHALIMQIVPHDSPGTLVFWHQRSQRIIWVTNAGGMGKNCPLSTNNSL